MQLADLLLSMDIPFLLFFWLILIKPAQWGKDYVAKYIKNQSIMLRNLYIIS